MSCLVEWSLGWKLTWEEDGVPSDFTAAAWGVDISAIFLGPRPQLLKGCHNGSGCSPDQPWPHVLAAATMANRLDGQSGSHWCITPEPSTYKVSSKAQGNEELEIISFSPARLQDHGDTIPGRKEVVPPCNVGSGFCIKVDSVDKLEELMGLTSPWMYFYILFWLSRMEHTYKIHFIFHKWAPQFIIVVPKMYDALKVCTNAIEEICICHQWTKTNFLSTWTAVHLASTSTCRILNYIKGWPENLYWVLHNKCGFYGMDSKQKKKWHVKKSEQDACRSLHDAVKEEYEVWLHLHEIRAVDSTTL